MVNNIRHKALCSVCSKQVYTRAYLKQSVLCTNCMFQKNLLKNYGLTLAVYNTLLEKQGNRCPICERLAASCALPGPGKHYGLVVDHCHKTNIVRGLLCHRCNTLLGTAKDRPDILKRALLYLENMLF